MKLTPNYFEITIKNHTSIDEILSYYHIAKKTRYQLYQENKIMVNHQIVKQNQTLLPSDLLTINYLEEHLDNITIDPNPIDILYEDNLFLIINKPAHLLVHSDGTDSPHLYQRVAYYYLSNGYDIPIRAIHRLDIETSGIIIFCKISLLQPYLDYLLSEKRISREYDALIEGTLNQKHFIIDKKIGRDRHCNKMRISNTGKSAKSEVYLIKNYDSYCHVHLKLYTGRTHQLRVHLSSINHPILSDTIYGNQSKLIKRLALHASKINIYHPILEKAITISCPLPQDMEKLIDQR